MEILSFNAIIIGLTNADALYILIAFIMMMAALVASRHLGVLLSAFPFMIIISLASNLQTLNKEQDLWSDISPANKIVRDHYSECLGGRNTKSECTVVILNYIEKLHPNIPKEVIISSINEWNSTLTISSYFGKSLKILDSQSLPADKDKRLAKLTKSSVEDIKKSRERLIEKGLLYTE